MGDILHDVRASQEWYQHQHDALLKSMYSLPNGIKTHGLNVVQVLQDALKGAAAIIIQVWTRWIARCGSEPVCEQLVDGSITPLSSRCRCGKCGDAQEAQCGVKAEHDSHRKNTTS